MVSKINKTSDSVILDLIRKPIHRKKCFKTTYIAKQIQFTKKRRKRKITQEEHQAINYVTLVHTTKYKSIT